MVKFKEKFLCVSDNEKWEELNHENLVCGGCLMSDRRETIVGRLGNKRRELFLGEIKRLKARFIMARL